MLFQEPWYARVHDGGEEGPELVERDVEGEVDFLNVGSEVCERFGGVGGDTEDIRVGCGESEVWAPCDFHALDAVGECGGVVVGGIAEGAWVARVVSGDDLEEDGGIFDGARHGAGLAEEVDCGGCSWAEVVGYSALCGFDAVDAAVSGGDADRAAAVAACGESAECGCGRSARAPAGSARRAFDVPWVAAVVSKAVLGVSEESVFRGVGLAEDDCARAFHALDDDGVVCADAIGVDQGAARGSDALGHFEVFDGDGQSVEGAEVVSAVYCLVGRRRGFEGEVGGDGKIGVEFGVERFDAGEVECGQFNR